MTVLVAQRVFDKRPDLSKTSVIHAVEHPISSRIRLHTDPLQTAGAGPDNNGRLLEWVAIPLDPPNTGWYVFHAMPITKKMLRELEIIQ
jgi:hypothetical protein